MQALENAYADIFTDIDDSIFSDGSIDPLGLQMIWTSIGNKIFHNKLNTVSSNIHFYTLNLFHHSLINKVKQLYDSKVVNLLGKAPYDNEADLYDGIVIFLECLLAHVLADNVADDANVFIPGVAKLKGILINRPGDKIAVSLPVDRKDGILVRHILLGIHGRHKGPFRQMSIFYKNDYYSDSLMWKQINSMFDKGDWKILSDALLLIIDKYILSAKVIGGRPIRVRLSDIKSDLLFTFYNNLLRNENFKDKELIDFWENRLGFNDESSTAALVYNFVKSSTEDFNYSEAFLKLAQENTNKDLQAIEAIEPLLTCIQKIMDRLLLRGTSIIEIELITFVKHHVNNPLIKPDEIEKYLTADFFSEEALKRLKALLDIYTAQRHSTDPVLFIQKLISFHHTIMKQRGNLAWLNVSLKGNITQHKSFSYTADRIDYLGNYEWVNGYYLRTVSALFNGLYN